jgi:hypothetical protein
VDVVLQDIGPVLGAAAVQVFQNGANILKDYVHLPVDPNNLQYILFGVLILLVLFFRPSGLLRESPVRLPVGSKGDGSGTSGGTVPAVPGGGDG